MNRYAATRVHRRRKPPHSCEAAAHICSRCKVEKKCQDFPDDRGRCYWCYVCRADYQKEHRQKQDHEQCRADQRSRYDPRRARDSTLRRLYGLTIEEYESRCEAQDNLCEICHRPSADGILRVDHDHDTGSIRGLLCDLCNRTLGFFGDSPETLDRAASYLRKHGRLNGALKYRGSSGTVTTIGAA